MSQKTRNESHAREKRSSKVIRLEAANTNSTRFNQIFARLKRGPEYREAFVESEISVGIPFQIRAMREGRDWTQKDLADRSGKLQSVISQLEDPGYGRLTLSTLRRLAAAFDVGLMVRFVPFSELAGRASNLSPDDMNVASFSDDAGIERKTSSGTEARIVAESSSSELLEFLPGAQRIGPKRAPGVDTSDWNRYERESQTDKA